MESSFVPFVNGLPINSCDIDLLLCLRLVNKEANKVISHKLFCMPTKFCDYLSLKTLQWSIKNLKYTQEERDVFW